MAFTTFLQPGLPAVTYNGSPKYSLYNSPGIMGVVTCNLNYSKDLTSSPMDLSFLASTPVQVFSVKDCLFSGYITYHLELSRTSEFIYELNFYTCYCFSESYRNIHGTHFYKMYFSPGQ